MFKYQSFDEYSRSNLKESIIYFNRYDFFNDPFECWCIENNDYPDPEKNRDRFLSVINTWGFTANRESEALEYYEEYVRELANGPGIVNAKKESARIACFSSEPDNLLMWSHYGNGLRGFCLELDDLAFATSQPSKCPVEIHQVNYRTSPPSIDAVAYSIAHDIFWHNEDINEGLKALYELDAKVLATKPFPWAYESEVRAITHVETETESGISIPYSPEFIKRVILGEKATQFDIEFIHDFVSEINPSIAIEIATREKHAYKVCLS
jgi:hypothetical protein